MPSEGLDRHRRVMGVLSRLLSRAGSLWALIVGVLTRSWHIAREHHRLNQCIQALDETLNEAVLERNHRLVALGQTLHSWLHDTRPDQPILHGFVSTIDELHEQVSQGVLHLEQAGRELDSVQARLQDTQNQWNERVSTLEDEHRCIKGEWTHCVRELKYMRKEQDHSRHSSDQGSRTAQFDSRRLRELGDKVADLELRLTTLDAGLTRDKHARSQSVGALTAECLEARTNRQVFQTKLEGLRSRHRATLMDLARESLLSPETMISETLTDRARSGQEEVEKVQGERRELVMERDQLDPRPYRILMGLLVLLFTCLIWALIF